MSQNYRPTSVADVAHRCHCEGKACSIRRVAWQLASQSPCTTTSTLCSTTCRNARRPRPPLLSVPRMPSITPHGYRTNSPALPTWCAPAVARHLQVRYCMAIPYASAKGSRHVDAPCEPGLQKALCVLYPAATAAGQPARTTQASVKFKVTATQTQLTGRLTIAGNSPVPA
jgi:hypothetical protein